MIIPLKTKIGTIRQVELKINFYPNKRIALFCEDIWIQSVYTIFSVNVHRSKLNEKTQFFGNPTPENIQLLKQLVKLNIITINPNKYAKIYNTKAPLCTIKNDALNQIIQIKYAY